MTVFGVGINDLSHIHQPNKRKAYLKWKDMLTRCYSKKLHQRHPIYAECSTSKEWLVFSNFYKWITSHINWDSLELDKDILFHGNKIYSPDTCALVPHVINSLLSDRYKYKGKYQVGVYFIKKSKKYFAQCRDGNSKFKYLGCFVTPELAHEAFCTYKAKVVRREAIAMPSYVDKRIKAKLLKIAKEIELGRYYK